MKHNILHLRDLITKDYILSLQGNDVEPPIVTDEALEMIKLYFSPYIEYLDQVTDFNFKPIIDQYPDKIRNNIYLKFHSGEIKYNLTPVDKNINEAYKYPQHTILETKIFIISELIEKLLFSNYEEVASEGVIDPWTIETHVRSRKVPQEFFHLEPFNEDVDISINIDVIINENKFVHSMSYELVKGIITFYKAYGLSHPLSLYGKTFNYETNRILPINYIPNYGYTVDLNGQRYKFSDIEFMRGLITAAQWNSVDPHKYILNLLEYKQPQYGSYVDGIIELQERPPSVEIILLNF